jgi:putative nucleotidyltransferase with HDIG domain
MVTVGLIWYIGGYQPRVLERPVRSLALAVLLLCVIACARGIEHFPYPVDLPQELCVFPIVAAGALLAISYDQRFAFGVSGILAILTTLAISGGIELLVTLIAAMSVMVFGLREIRTRSKVVGMGGLAAFAALAASLGTGLMEGQSFLKYVLPHALVAASAALFAGFFVQGVLPNFEKLFGVATSMTLLEWSDANKPLLRRLAQDAPGTYSHSLILAQMAEEAAETIEARGLLARVGALYHDIGKLQKAEYFVENQESRTSRHERLSPTMSLLIIIGHVKDGIEMARAYGLPRVLHQFITEHHGSTVVRYFHHAASEAAAAKSTGRHDRGVPESEFRYPGPRPQTRETAILMLCDSTEGAVRALSEPSPGRIESTVHQVVMDRLNDGQFDECDITLRELKLVETSLVKSLTAVHHARVKYPKGQRPPAAGPRKSESAILEVASPEPPERSPHAAPAAASTPEVVPQT